MRYDRNMIEIENFSERRAAAIKYDLKNKIEKKSADWFNVHEENKLRYYRIGE